MRDETEDLDALFEEIAAQRPENQGDQNQNQPPANDTELPSMPENPFFVKEFEGAQPLKQTSGDNPCSPMYERLGGIVRLLHDSLRELGYDRSLSDVASQVSDAQGRLEYVAALTEQAANKVLNAIDEGLPAQEALAIKAQEMEKRWAALFAGDMPLEDFKALARESQNFAAETARSAEIEKTRMLDIMMAQDFQDITGQLIKKIVVITTTVEKELAQLLREHAPVEHKPTFPNPVLDQTPELMAGPGIPGTAMQQDGVDDLLDSLGF